MSYHSRLRVLLVLLQEGRHGEDNAASNKSANQSTYRFDNISTYWLPASRILTWLHIDITFKRVKILQRHVLARIGTLLRTSTEEDVNFSSRGGKYVFRRPSSLSSWASAMRISTLPQSSSSLASADILTRLILNFVVKAANSLRFGVSEGEKNGVFMARANW